MRARSDSFCGVTGSASALVGFGGMLTSSVCSPSQLTQLAKRSALETWPPRLERMKVSEKERLLPRAMTRVSGPPAAPAFVPTAATEKGPFFRPGALAARVVSGVGDDTDCGSVL